MSSAEVQGVQSPASSEESASQRHETLLKDLQKQVALLEADLRERAAGEEFASSLLSEYHRADAEGRIGVGYETWLDDRLVQIAAAWVLACVFVRFSEDNGLIPDAWLSGPGERLSEAQDRHDDYFRAYPEHNDRDWLFEAFGALSDAHPTAAGLFDERFNPLWEVTPSYGAATRLLSFWRERDAEGQVRHDFTDPELNTRFLGDLYQDLSEHARKTYALLQTPVFVEEFILDLTLEPAVEEFGLDPVWKHRPDGWRGEIDEDGQVRGLRCIDPACGSGHFLLGLFERIFNKWRELEPGTDRWVLIRRALESVHGADKNPFAASIARFRLLVAALKEGGVRELRRAPAMPIRVAVGDSLLHGREAGQEADATFDDLARAEVFTYRTEDVKEYVREVDLLGRGSYHVVVANPPYITVKDKQENQNYRDVYWASSRQYSLSVPFAQRIFELALRAGGNHQDGGFTGQITANSFMKREFGKVLVQTFFYGGTYKDSKSRRLRDFGGVDLTHIVDTSGAYIPGHGTPTVILAGRNQVARQAQPIRAVLGIRGEPGQPDEASEGHVWQDICRAVRRPGTEKGWVSAVNAGRERFRHFPWSLQGGSSHELMAQLHRASSQRLGARVHLIGRTAHTGADSAYFAPLGTWSRRGVPKQSVVPLVEGTVIRDWDISPETESVFPYGSDLAPSLNEPSVERLLWRLRSELRERREPGGTHEEIGLTWYEWSRWHPERYTIPLGIAFAFVATHNHFVLDRGGRVFKQSAPVIKLPDGASEEQHLELMGVLNSSAACFWLKQVSQGKGGSGLGRGVQDEEWEERYEFTGTKLEDFPLPGTLPLALSRELDALAQELVEFEPAAVSASCMPTRSLLDKASETQGRIRSRMIYLQEELDWTVYGAYGLLTAKEVAATTLPGMPADLNDDDVPQLLLGQRAFEMALKQKVDAGETETAWFGRHSSWDTAVSGVPAAWPDTYKKVVQARLDLIAANKDIRLLERPEYKRRWFTEPWAKREAAALRAWLLDATEREELWFGERGDYTAPRTLTVYQLADALRHDEDVQSVAALYAADHLKKPEASLATVLQAVIENEHVPYLAALRYKESGLRKRAQWERVWEQQREEDRTGERLDIKVPPKYSGADFLRHSYWSNRGKLDVPKERFISYPGASTDSDPSLLLGWAGWNHRDQAEALVNLISDRAEQDGWKREDPRFVPLLAGLLEIMPWVHQWYDEYDEEWGDSPAREFQTALNKGCADRHLSEADLRDWRPEKRRGGRSKAAE
ncbi:BREX-2 system adenine-specific DNA-methyltransferase PglX [Streptomyces coelicoflavus]|uniref:BREX-2 system adenine-specific DNA-methyltransferase PglX n=1 Tax=Streptomyces coelicoflavus TaxID=285562 RepID=UPI00224CED47|nr:BREX-2 system adenine-specific DNA-methyltransferase PglX [Streptomyces coelicoflavus]MCX5036860.1 BREX-2 system adenine-specific DNA-methyltransferase PglX [Streptomyces coelicoflavus]